MDFKSGRSPAPAPADSSESGPINHFLLYNTFQTIGWTQSARRHRVGRASARFIMEAVGAPAVMENGDLLWVGRDERDRELEIIAVLTENGIVVKHVMPTTLRRTPRW